MNERIDTKGQIDTKGHENTKEHKYTMYITFGLILGSIIGLFLDIYQIDIFGAVGLGIVYTPVIGLLCGVLANYLVSRQ